MDKILTFSIAAYNVEDTIEETLSSLICDEETMRHIEALVVDDGSTDNTYDKVLPFLEKYPYTFVYVKKENGGHGSTLTYSIQHARGKYMRMLDGDDMVSGGVLTDYVSFLTSADLDVVVSPFVEFYANGREDLMDRHSLEHGEVYSITDTEDIQSHEFAYRTSLLKDKGIQLEENCVYTDEEYCFYVTVYANSLSKYDKVIYRYRKGIEGQTVSDEGRRRRPEDYKRVLFKIMSEYDKYTKYADLSQKRTQIYKMYNGLLWGQSDNILRLCKYTEEEKRKKYLDLYEGVAGLDENYLRYYLKEALPFSFQHLLYTLPIKKQYIVWGCGNYGERSVPLIQELYHADILVTDSNSSKWGEDFFGEKIVSPQEAVKKREKESVFVVAMKDGGEVKNQLVNWGVDVDSIFSLT